MENQIQQDVPPVQQLTQTPTSISTPPSTKRSKILLFIVFGLFVVMGLVFAVIQIGKNQISNRHPVVVQPTIAPTGIVQMTITGVIRTSGLSEDEKQKFGLSNVTYQFTDFNKNDKQNLYGYYLISNDKTIEAFLGKCVQITGAEPSEWKNKDKADSYLRTAIILSTISLIDTTECSPYSTTPTENVAGAEKMTLRGMVTDSNRPAPDIFYDYQIKLSKPFLDKDNSSGSPQQVSLVVTVPDTNIVWVELMNNINHEIELQGYMEWGYAESKYFRITSIKSL
jgi:hypothetical protein